MGIEIASCSITRGFFFRETPDISGEKKWDDLREILQKSMVPLKSSPILIWRLVRLASHQTWKMLENTAHFFVDQQILGFEMWFGDFPSITMLDYRRVFENIYTVDYSHGICNLNLFLVILRNGRVGYTQFQDIYFIVCYIPGT